MEVIIYTVVVIVLVCLVLLLFFRVLLGSYYAPLDVLQVSLLLGGCLVS